MNPKMMGPYLLGRYIDAHPIPYDIWLWSFIKLQIGSWTSLLQIHMLWNDKHLETIVDLDVAREGMTCSMGG